MSPALDPEEARLDALWRARFGQPLPIRGCVGLALAILGEEAVFAEPGPPVLLGRRANPQENRQLGVV